MKDAKVSEEQLGLWIRGAAEGDRDAAHSVLATVQDDVYRLALRMLGHPADAEDATQEILVIVLTHIGSFRGDSALSTWVWRIAANHLRRVRIGRREAVSVDALAERLDAARAARRRRHDRDWATFTISNHTAPITPAARHSARSSTCRYASRNMSRSPGT
jgi:RNA polymerase sigma factor (sigma-70 family)